MTSISNLVVHYKAFRSGAVKKVNAKVNAHCDTYQEVGAQNLLPGKATACTGGIIQLRNSLTPFGMHWTYIALWVDRSPYIFQHKATPCVCLHLFDAGNADGSHRYPHDYDSQREEDVSALSVPHRPLKVRRSREFILHAHHLRPIYPA